MQLKPKHYVLIIAIGLFLIILIQNSQVIFLYFLFWRIQISLVLLIVLIMVIGFASGYLTHSIILQRRKQKR